jgi:hypothetical protein
VLERAAGAPSADGGWTDIERPDAEDEEIAVTGFLRTLTKKGLIIRQLVRNTGKISWETARAASRHQPL